MTKPSGASFGEAIRLAFDSLRGAKLRSFLTLLGIILATTTLIAVIAAVALFIYVIRAPLETCARTCECQLAGRDVPALTALQQALHMVRIDAMEKLEARKQRALVV